MAFKWGILLAILAAAWQSVITWRGMKSSAIITNPFPELPDDVFRKCADMVKLRYKSFFICCLVILVSFILIYIASLKAGSVFYIMGVFGIFAALLFFALGIFERRKVEETLEPYKHNWKDLTQSIAAHQP